LQKYKIMKILIAGSKWHDNLLNAADFGFSELGHKVEIFDDNLTSLNLLASKIVNRSPFRGITDKYLHRYREFIGAEFVKKVDSFRPDFVFVINGIKYLPQTILKISKAFRIPVAAYIVDDPLLSRIWIYDLSAYSHLFVIDKSWMGYLEFFNPGEVSYLSPTADHRVFRPLFLKEEYDIGFGGALSLRLPNAPSGFLRAQILNFLAQQGIKIKAFAPGIKEAIEYFPDLKNIDYYDGYKNLEELNDLYNKSKIVLTIHSPQFKTGISPRVFEAAFAKSFQLVEYKDDALKLFPEGIKTFSSPSELIDLVEYYLQRKEEREKLAKKAYVHALKFHTWKSRPEQILSFVKNS